MTSDEKYISLISMEFEDIRRIGIGAAYKGGEVLSDCFGRISDIRKKGAIDLVTEADLNSEKAILEIIRSRCPDHSVLAEESGAGPGDSDSSAARGPMMGCPMMGGGMHGHGMPRDKMHMQGMSAEPGAQITAEELDQRIAHMESMLEYMRTHRDMMKSAPQR